MLPLQGNPIMKIAVSDNGLWDRFVPFLNTLKRNGHEIIVHKDKSITPSSDIWLFDYHDKSHELMVENCNKYVNQLLDYKGKLIIYTIDDSGASFCPGLSNFIKNRIDAWITFVLWPKGHMFRDETIADKFVLIPRYSIEYRPFIKNIKQNKFVFIGNLTGAYNFSGKNLRMECVKRIKDSYLNKYFIGGFVGNKLFDVPEERQKLEYHKSYQQYSVKNISSEEWQKWIDENLIYLHIQGNSKWSYRQPQSMRSKTAVITPPLPNDPRMWFMEDVFGDCFYYVKEDYSNMEEVVEYALLNTKETVEKAEFGYDVYRKYLELTPNNEFKSNIWDIIKTEFEKLNIYL